MSSARPKAKRPLNPVERIDLAVSDVAAIDGRTLAGKRVGAFAQLGDQPPLRLLCAVTIAAGAVRRDPKLMRTGLRMLAAHGVATGIKGFFKHRIDRTRPSDAMENKRYRLDRGDSHQSRLSSMPSGHSAGIAAVASAIAREYPAAAPVAGAGATAIVVAQLPAKNHFLSDVVVGTAIGLASEAAVSALMGAAGGRD
jgi:membrane-associated phospholipid phosphatase